MSLADFSMNWNSIGIPIRLIPLRSLMKHMLAVNVSFGSRISFTPVKLITVSEPMRNREPCSVGRSLASTITDGKNLWNSTLAKRQDFPMFPWLLQPILFRKTCIESSHVKSVVALGIQKRSPSTAASQNVTLEMLSKYLCRTLKSGCG